MTTTVLPFEARHYARIKTLHSFAELVQTQFAGGVNALCWPRALADDFAEVAEQLAPGEDISTNERLRCPLGCI